MLFVGVAISVLFVSTCDAQNDQSFGNVLLNLYVRLRQIYTGVQKGATPAALFRLATYGMQLISALFDPQQFNQIDEIPTMSRATFYEVIEWIIKSQSRYQNGKLRSVEAEDNRCNLSFSC